MIRYYDTMYNDTIEIIINIIIIIIIIINDKVLWLYILWQ